MSCYFPPGTRYFENVVLAANTSKFWGYALRARGERGIVVEVFWGRIGTTGSSKPFPFENDLDARDFVNDKMVEKLRGGYVERDAAWVERMHGSWVPPMAVYGVDPMVRAAARAPKVEPKRPPLIVPPEPVRPRWPGRIGKPPVPAVAKAQPVVVARAKRVIDFSEDD